MADTPAYTHGDFCWHEISTRDREAARAFYAGVLGWASEDAPMGPNPEDVYTTLKVGDGGVAGLYDMSMGGSQSDGIPPHWDTAIWVDDVAASTEKAKTLGAAVLMEPMEMPGIGHMSVIKDPTGAVIELFKGTGHPGAARLEGTTPGVVSWNELMTRDTAAAKAFYGAVFGWGSRSRDMGDFEYIVFQKGGHDIAGMMAMAGPEWEGIPEHWMNYVTVADVDATVAKAVQLGGSVRVPPMDIPEIGRFAVLQDSTGAHFSVIAYVASM